MPSTEQKNPMEDKFFLHYSENTTDTNSAKRQLPFELLGITIPQFKELFRFNPNVSGQSKIWLYLVGILLTPITLTGALLGYVRGYNKFMKVDNLPPELHPLKPIIKVAMVIGAILIWVVFIALIIFIVIAFGASKQMGLIAGIYLIVNTMLTLLVFALFKKWQAGIQNVLIEGEKFGSARYARPSELEKYKPDGGFYVGGGYTFTDKGHLITVAGTRGGKGTNIIIPNLLGLGGYTGSWVVIDPKAENACITASYQKASGKDVVILNPWGLFEDILGTAQSYNPLDILADKTSINLIDDVTMIAEMIVPIDNGDKNKFFTDNARAIIAGIILYIVITKEKEDRTLKTLWSLTRLSGTQWDDLIAQMILCEDEINGEVVRNSGNEIKKLMAAGGQTFGSIISTVLQSTDFLKSPALQQSLQSGYDPATLADGNTCLFIIIPADKLQSHARWLRLIVTTTMRAVIRKPKQRVCFLLDEFAALGYLPEIETALSTYAGYQVTVWPILQNLIQLQSIYGNNWETFTSNTAVKNYFNVNDNFTADYVSKSIGKTSHVLTKSSWFGVSSAESNPRDLVTADELRRYSKEYIFSFIGDAPPTYYSKLPYYEMDGIKDRASDNPYMSKP